MASRRGGKGETLFALLLGTCACAVPRPDVNEPRRLSTSLEPAVAAWVAAEVLAAEFTAHRQDPLCPDAPAVCLGPDLYLVGVVRREGGVFAPLRGGTFRAPNAESALPAPLSGLAFVAEEQRPARQASAEWIRIAIAPAPGGAELRWSADPGPEDLASVLAHLRRALSLAERFEEAAAALPRQPARSAALAALERLDPDPPCCASHTRLRARLAWLEGCAQLRLRATEPARTALREALRLDRDLAPAMVALAWLEERTSELPEAEAWFTELALHHRGRPAGAEGVAGALRVEPQLSSESPEVCLVGAARSCAQSGDAEAELLALTRAVQACPAEAGPLSALALCHEREGRPRAAQAAWLACMLRFPASADAARGLARCDRMLGRAGRIEQRPPAAFPELPTVRDEDTAPAPVPAPVPAPGR